MANPDENGDEGVGGNNFSNSFFGISFCGRRTNELVFGIWMCVGGQDYQFDD